MDKLAKKLREDAERIDATISPQLDDRIDASLRAVSPESAKNQPSRSWSFWLASSLTGAAVALTAIVILSVRSPEPLEPPHVVQTQQLEVPFEIPAFKLKAETAVLTAPLQQELDALQSDLRKVEQKVREDMGL